MDKESFDYSSLWQEVHKQMQSSLTEQEYIMWFRNIKFSSSDETSLYLSVPSSFYRDQIKQRYLSRIENLIQELIGSRINIQFIIKKAEIKQTINNIKKDIPKVKKNKPKVHPGLKSEYTFDKFVIGDNNSFAANASIAISRNPGTAYNPCLIYGGVGLGKTHLVQAIGNEALNTIPENKIVYVSAETFTNEFISSIKERKTHLFKKKYRTVTLLLIDDIHILQKKTETQEELFYTFEALYNSNKQMVFTCDRPVSELKEITDRLRNRFERGLNVDLQPPNLETRIAILKKKTEDKNIKIQDDVIELICNNITTNVRDLEAALTKLIAYSELVNKNITLEIAQKQLRDFFASPNLKNININIVQRVVAEYFNLSHNDLRGKKRTKAVAFPRQLAMYLSREMTEFSTTEVGIEFGGRDHTTVMYSCQKIENLIKTDSTLEPIIQNLKRTIRDSGINS